MGSREHNLNSKPLIFTLKKIKNCCFNKLTCMPCKIVNTSNSIH